MGATYVLPRIFRFYTSMRSRKHSNTNGIPGIHDENAVRPCPPAANRSLNILFFSAVVFFFFTLPPLSPSNIFVETSSDTNTPTLTLFNRLESVRPLTGLDVKVRDAFRASHEARSLYAVYGPNVLTECTICGGDLPVGGAVHPDYYSTGGMSPFVLFSIPRLMIPHLVHFLLIGLATSPAVGGYNAFCWRTVGVSTSLVLMVIELAAVSKSSPASLTNVRWAPDQAPVLLDTYFSFWSFRMIRFLAFVLVDVVLALSIWLWATNRWPGQRPDPVLQIIEAEEAIRAALPDVEQVFRTRRALQLMDKSGAGSKRSSRRTGRVRRRSNHDDDGDDFCPEWRSEDPAVLDNELDLPAVRLHANAWAATALKDFMEPEVPVEPGVKTAPGLKIIDDSAPHSDRPSTSCSPTPATRRDKENVEELVVVVDL